MRVLSMALLLAPLGSCSKPQVVDQIYIRESGEVATDIVVNSRGQAHFHVSDYPKDRSGAFAWSPRQFRDLQGRLEPFQRKSTQFTVARAESFIMQGCPKGVPFIYDVGAIYVRWTGPGIDQQYLADLGCDYQRNAIRNRELLSIVNSFPVPSLHL